MYQPYPAGGANPVGPVERPPAPPSVLNAVKLMYAGAGLSALSLILEFVSLSGIKSALHKASPDLTNTQIHSIEIGLVAFSTIIGLIGIGLWIWMALASKAGHNYARIVSSILFGLYTIFFLYGISRTGLQLGNLVSVLVWLAGLGAIILVWRKESSAFFQPGMIR
jgi:hypothetical protein